MLKRDELQEQVEDSLDKGYKAVKTGAIKAANKATDLANDGADKAGDLADDVTNALTSITNIFKRNGTVMTKKLKEKAHDIKNDNYKAIKHPAALAAFALGVGAVMKMFNGSRK